MPQTIVYVDRSEVRPGKLDELKKALNELVDFIQSNEKQLLAYNVYFNADGSRMTVMHVHTDPASLAAHMRIAGPKFPRFAEFIRMEAIDIYGEPDGALVGQLRAKAATLGSGRVNVHALHGGFVRFEAD